MRPVRPAGRPWSPSSTRAPSIDHQRHADIIAAPPPVRPGRARRGRKPGKQPVFGLEERVRWPARRSRDAEGRDRVVPHPADGLRARAGRERVLRGLRAVSDFEYEFQLASMNADSPRDRDHLPHAGEQYAYISRAWCGNCCSGRRCVRVCASGRPARAPRHLPLSAAVGHPLQGAAVMALLITDECINCDVCEPSARTAPSRRATRSTSSIRISAPSASATTTPRSASRSAGRLHHPDRTMRRPRTSSRRSTSASRAVLTSGPEGLRGQA